jgi:hypothetical protein
MEDMSSPMIPAGIGVLVRSAALAAALLTVGAQAGVAQSRLGYELRGGASVPAGDLAEVSDPGASVGVGVDLPLGSRFLFRIDGDLEVLSEDFAGGLSSGPIMPKAYLWHYHAGLEMALTGDASPWRISLRGGAGGTTYDTEVFSTGDDFLDTYFSVNGGLKIGRSTAGSLEWGVIGQAFVVFTDEDRTMEFARESPVLNPFPAASSFPIQIYLRWSPSSR